MVTAANTADQLHAARHTIRNHGAVLEKVLHRTTAKHRADTVDLKKQCAQVGKQLTKQNDVFVRELKSLRQQNTQQTGKHEEVWRGRVSWLKEQLEHARAVHQEHVGACTCAASPGRM